LRVLLKNERFHHLDEMYLAFAEELDHRLGITTAEVTTTRPLTTSEESQLKTRLEKLTGKQVRLQAAVEPGIIGGVVARIGSDVYDGSIRTKLERIQKELSS
jgi:F-type H+-transporting ATPase subunit delta